MRRNRCRDLLEDQARLSPVLNLRVPRRPWVPEGREAGLILAQAATEPNFRIAHHPGVANRTPSHIAAHHYTPAWPYPCAHVLIQLKSHELRRCSNAAAPSQSQKLSGRSHQCCCQLGCETSFWKIPGPHQLDVAGSFGPTSPQNCIARRSHSGLPRAH